MALFGGLFGGGSSLVGIDVGASGVKIITGTKKKNGFHVDRLALLPLPARSIDERGFVNFDAVNSAIQEAVNSLGLKNPSVATALRGAGIITKRIVIPDTPPSEIRESLKYDAEQVFPQDIDTVLLSYVILGKLKGGPNMPADQKSLDIFLIGAREEDGFAYNDAIEAAGASVKQVDLDAFVVVDFLSTLVDVPKDEAVAFVDVGAAATRFAVHEKGNVCFIREFPIGGNAFTESIATALGLTFENAEALKIQDNMGIPQDAMDAIQAQLVSWKSELQQCEDIFITQSAVGSIAKIYLYGGAAKTPGLSNVLSDPRFAERAFMIPAHEFLHTSGKHVDANLLASIAPRLLTAAGLGCRKG